MAGGPLELWNHRSIQILVLLSLALQFVLFVFSGIRRREDAPVRRFLLWLAYLMADSTAVYALGHLSFSSSVQPEHQLVTFWAPFLLMHLGGPDNITAYALQDNQLWLRHLQILIVQVLGAAYVVKKNIDVGGGGGPLLRLATYLMFSLGVVKYVERTWALRCGTLENIGVSVKTQPPAIHNHYHPEDESPEEEFLLRRAHSLFHICKRAIVDSSVIEKDVVEGYEEYTTGMMDRVELWALMEIELSLMYDVLYTKAFVAHTFFGYLLRLVSPLVAAASLLLFHFAGNNHGHSRVDVAITYVLLGGAVAMETTSLLNALGSSWTFAFLSTTSWQWLRYAALCNRRWDRLRRLVVSLHQLVKVGGSRYRSRRWSYTMGQYNMLHFCTRPADTPFTSPLLGRLAKRFGPNEWWNRNHFSASAKLTPQIRHAISTYMKRLYSKGKFNTGLLRKKWGEDPLERRKLYTEGGILRDSLGVEFQEGIIIWHLATEIFLAKGERAQAKEAAACVEAIRKISDYMMFLLVDRPYMLPGQPQKRLYQRICKKLVAMRSVNSKYLTQGTIKNMFRVRDGPDSRTTRVAERKELANYMYDEYEDMEFSHTAPRLTHVARLAKELLRKERDNTIDSLELVLDVWMDILIYAGNKCSRNSHAQKLNSGGEMTTILWLMAEHLYQASLW